MRSLHENALRQQFDSESGRKNARTDVTVAISAAIVYRQADGREGSS